MLNFIDLRLKTDLKDFLRIENNFRGKISYLTIKVAISIINSFVASYLSYLCMNDRDDFCLRRL